jgi:hypothetical protein
MIEVLLQTCLRSAFMGLGFRGWLCFSLARIPVMATVLLGSSLRDPDPASAWVSVLLVVQNAHIETAVSMICIGSSSLS